MSKTDNARLPRIGKRTLVTESDDMGVYSFTIANDEQRREVQRKHEDKRANTQARVLHNREVADLDMREQVRDALFSAPYTGPVGTRVQDTPMPDCESVSEVVVQHVVPQRARMNESNRREREEFHLEREMRALGFGGRYGITL